LGFWRQTRWWENKYKTTTDMSRGFARISADKKTCGQAGKKGFSFWFELRVERCIIVLL
jgi:hypothetical protein